MTSSCDRSDLHVRAEGPGVLCVASTGGHFVQLTKIMAGLPSGRAHFVSTARGDASLLVGYSHETIPEASRTSRLSLARCAWRILRILLRHRPSLVVSTGAAPGYLAVRLGHLLGARTVWIDSVANVEEVSMAGRLARPHSDLFLVQWPHLAEAGQGEYRGSVL